MAQWLKPGLNVEVARYQEKSAHLMETKEQRVKKIAEEDYIITSSQVLALVTCLFWQDSTSNSKSAVPAL